MKRADIERLERRCILALALTAGVLFSAHFYLNCRDAVHVAVVPPPQAETAS